MGSTYDSGLSNIPGISMGINTEKIEQLPVDTMNSVATQPRSTASKINELRLKQAWTELAAQPQQYDFMGRLLRCESKRWSEHSSTGVGKGSAVSLSI